METLRGHLGQQGASILIPMIILALILVLGVIAKRILFRIKRILFRMLTRWSSRTKTRADDLVVVALRGAFMIWVLILGLHIATLSCNLPERALGFLGKAFLFIWIISLVGSQEENRRLPSP